MSIIALGDCPYWDTCQAHNVHVYHSIRRLSYQDIGQTYSIKLQAYDCSCMVTIVIVTVHNHVEKMNYYGKPEESDLLKQSCVYDASGD